MNTLVLWLPRVLFTGAAAALLWCAFVLTETRWFQHREGLRLEQALRAGTGIAPPVIPGLVGRVEVPRLDISVIVMEGTGGAVLRHAAGHIVGTALPGEPGNTAISAHRDTFFRPLRHVRVNDEITVTTTAGHYRYRVLSTEVTSPDNVSVLKATTTEILTLVTCYPFYFVGEAPERFIVRAARVT